MARSQALGFGELLAGGVLLTAGISGRSIREVLAGKASPLRPLVTSFPTGSAASMGGSGGGAGGQFASLPGNLPRGGPAGPGIIAVGRWLQSLGFQIGEHPAFGGVDPGAHVSGSAHDCGCAFDVNWPNAGSEPARLDWLVKILAKLPHAQIIWRNHDIDTGAYIPDHMDHLHFATCSC